MILSGSLQEERNLKLLLKGRDGTGFAGKRGFQVSEGLVRGLAGVRQIGLGAALGEGGSYVALAVLKTFPDPICRRDTEIHVQSAKGFSLVAERNHDEIQEPPQDVRAKAQALEFIGGPYAEGVPAAVVALFAIVAEDAPPATRSQPIVLRITEEIAVEYQRTGAFAGRARQKFQALMQAKKIILRTVEPWKRKEQRKPPNKKRGLYRP